MTAAMTQVPVPTANEDIQAGCGKIDALAGIKKALEATGIRAIASDGQQDADAPSYNV